MSKIKCEFNFDNLQEAQDFFYCLHLQEMADAMANIFQKDLYEKLKEKTDEKSTKEVELLKKIIKSYNSTFSDFVGPLDFD